LTPQPVAPRRQQVETEEPAPQRGFPVWLWAVGGGGLGVMLVTLLIVLVSGAGRGENAAAKKQEPAAEAKANPQGNQQVPPLFLEKQPGVANPPANVGNPPGVPANPPAGDELNQLLADLKGGDIIRRMNAAKRLGQMAPNNRRAEVARALETALTDNHFFVRMDAFNALGVWGSAENVPAVVAAVNHPDVSTRNSAMQLLGKWKDVRGAEPVAARLPDGLSRHNASQALQAMGKIAEAAVSKYLSHPDVFVRREACLILRAIGTRASLAALQEAARDGNGLVSGAAAEAIKAIGARP
jgi:hypothetical protein